ncbi:MAG: glycosyltransferase family 39 protein [Planctomycetota bacterium]|nr:glycosyltransferase family 39 protein [Planctomycetota bacterium]
MNTSDNAQALRSTPLARASRARGARAAFLPRRQRPIAIVAAYALPAILLLALWLPGCNQGWLRTDSHVYASIGLQAWRAGDLWNLRVGEALYFNKPPLVFWVHGLFLHVFGFSVWASRLPSLLAAIGAAVATVHLARRITNLRIGACAGMVLALSVEFFRYTRAISLDLWLVLFLMIGLAMIAEGWRSARDAERVGATCDESQRRARRWIVASGVAFGLALLTKPFMGISGPLVAAAWLAWEGVIARSERGVRARPLWPWALASAGVALLVASPWHIGQALTHPDLFWNVYLFEQSLDRAVKTQDPQPWWYYGRMLGENYHPWLLLTVLCLIAWGQGKLGRSGTSTPGTSTPGVPGDRSLLRLSLLWSVLWLVALTFFAGKSGRYAVVVYPLLAMPSAIWLVHLAPVWLRRGGITTSLRLAGVLLLVAIVLAAVGLRVHRGVDDHIRELAAAFDGEQVSELESSTGVPTSTPLYATFAANREAHNLYLLRGVMPRLARLPAGWNREGTASDAGTSALEHPTAAAATVPPPGALLVTSSDQAPLFAPYAARLWTGGGLELFRVERGWE